ncbi:MAG TPA: hypothetical protein VGR90_04575 [Acidimicrobiales bacterium]|nr:hypothetical protein [Acidimicrobiales bacterium]
MRRRLRQAWAWFHTDKVQRSVRLLAVAAGFGALKQILEEHDKRLEELEERGLVPIDDLVTIRDLVKVETRIGALEAPAGDVADTSEAEASGA